MPLYGTHHDAFDLHLFGINPEDLSVVVAVGFEGDDLGIQEPILKLLHNRPHREALEWRWTKTRKAWAKIG